MPPPARRSWRPTIIKLHAWGGLILALWMFMITVTGVFLGFRDSWVRFTIPEAGQAWVARTPEQIAEQLARIDQRYPGQVRSVTLARVELMADEVTFKDDGGAYLDPLTGEVLDQWAQNRRFMPLCLIGFLLAGSGLYLWFAYSNKFELDMPWFTASRPTLVAAHRDWGFVWAVPLLFTVATGVALVWPNQLRSVLAGPMPAPAASGSGPIAWRPIVEAADKAFEPSVLRIFIWPSPTSPAVNARIWQPGEWTLNGESRAWFAPGTGALLTKEDSKAVSGGVGFVNAMHPIHAGHAFGPFHLALLRFMGCFVALMTLYGAIAFWRKLRKDRQKALKKRVAA
jgi:uncharacterized iron-regulated membrane protein